MPDEPADSFAYVSGWCGRFLDRHLDPSGEQAVNLIPGKTLAGGGTDTLSAGLVAVVACKSDQVMRNKGVRGVRPRSRRILAWTVLLFFGGQVLVNIVSDRRWPDVRDPRQGAWLSMKLERLRACQRSHPGRPLVMMFGSSMT